MMDNSTKHGVGIVWRNLMSLIHNYQLKWLPADIALITDIFANGVWGGEYYKLFEVFGIEASTINSCISALQLIRVCVLLYQGAVERQAKAAESSSLHDEKKLGDD